METIPVAEVLAQDLCSVFLGWRLREDRDALVSLEEGALRIDLDTGECWCDGEPLPALFIAGELRSQLSKVAEREKLALRRATLEAAFSIRSTWARGEAATALDLACRVSLEFSDGSESTAESNNAQAR